MLTILAGGTGSAKLLGGVARFTSEDITVIVNVGDNVFMHDLYITPDIDTVLYTLSGSLDTCRGWGVQDDTFHFIEQISKYGLDNWFKIGDKDLAIHVARTEMMRRGLALTEITRILADKMGISQTVLPASDQHIETRIDTPMGEMNLQEFLVKFKGEPEVTGVSYHGPKYLQPASGVVEAIRGAEKVIICPANPATSIGPIIHIPSIKSALSSVKEHVVAVSPIVGKKPVSGPADKFLNSLGVDVSSKGVTEFYLGCISKMIIDKSDNSAAKIIGRLGVDVFSTDIIMKNERDARRLAEFVVNA